MRTALGHVGATARPVSSQNSGRFSEILVPGEGWLRVAL